MSDDIDYGIEIPGAYDGVAIWVHKDGTVTNRFRGVDGFGSRADKIDEYIRVNGYVEKHDD
jgi:hypothetical protein